MPLPGVQSDANAQLPLTALEFYHPGLDHFFVTASPNEITALNSGQFAGWVPTGFSFPVLSGDSEGSDTAAVCRFYGSPAMGLDSHFYSASPDECGDVQRKFASAWLLESENVFRVYAADVTSGACPSGTNPVRRLWNTRSDVNHRYTDSDAVALEMASRGYVPEGYGAGMLPTVFCVPKAAAGIACTASASNTLPTVGGSVTLTATCAGNPTSYQWIGCTGSGNNCTATASSAGARAYVVTAANGTSASTPAIVSVVWQRSPTAQPVTPSSVACSIVASKLNPIAGETVTLNATCTGTPTRYTWTGCASSTNTCVINSAAAGTVTYSVVASNGSNTSTPTSIIVNWKSAASAIACTLVASNASPAVNSTVTLTTSCTGTPTSYAWTGCSSATSTCATTSTATGARAYVVTATNGAGGSATALVSVNWLAAGTPPPPGTSAVACTLSANNATPIINTQLTLTANCAGSPTSYTWTGCSSTTGTCSTSSSSTGSASYSVIARNASGTSAPASATVSWLPVPVVPPGMPTSADFVSRAWDPRGIDAGYNSFKRTGSGHAIPFGGHSHNRAGNNSVVTYDPVADRWSVRQAHTPWVDRPLPPATSGPPWDARGLAFLGNSDNGSALVVDSEYWHFRGERGQSITGNYRGILDAASWRWTFIDDVGTDWPRTEIVNDDRLRDFQNAAYGYIPALDMWYMFGGALNGNPWDGLYRIERNPGRARPYKATFYGSPVWGNQAFSGAERLRYISNQHFARGTKLYVYGGLHENRSTAARTSSSTLWEIDIVAPSMRPISVNSLPPGQRVAGDKLLAYHDPQKDLMVVTNGALVNVFDFATGAWVNVVVNTAADPDRLSPSGDGAGRAAFYSPEVGQMIILGGHSRVYGLRLNYGSGPPPTPPTPPPPPPTPPPQPPVPPAAGNLNLAVTQVPYTGVGWVLGSSKHLDFAYLGSRWYKMVGDHRGLDPTTTPPMQQQSGRQELLSFNVPANDWRQETPYYLPSGVQQAFPDDAYTIARRGEAFVFAVNTTVALPPFQPPGKATQVWGRIMAYKPGVGYRDVGPMPFEVMSNRSWRGTYDAVRDRFVIPAHYNDHVWVVIDAATGADLTTRNVNGRAAGVPGFDFHVAGIVGDESSRTRYLYDHLKSELWSVDLDSFVLTKLANIPEPSASGAATLKLAWHPDLRVVVLAAARMHAFEVDTKKLTSWTRQDGLDLGGGSRVLPSTIFFDPDTRDLITIGGIDWNTGRYSPGYWRVKITR